MYDTTYDPYTYQTTSDVDAGAMFAIFGVIAVLGIIAYVVNSIFLGMVFKKAGVESWKAWVPVYNLWVFMELGGQKGWLSLLVLANFIPFVGWIGGIVGVVFACIAAYRIGLNFGKEGVFVLLYIFLGLVWTIWLAVDKTAVWKPVDGGQSAPPEKPAAPSQPAAM